MPVFPPAHAPGRGRGVAGSLTRVPGATWKQLKELVPLVKKGHCSQRGIKLENSSLPFGQGCPCPSATCLPPLGGASHPVGTTRPDRGRSHRRPIH